MFKAQCTKKLISWLKYQVRLNGLRDREFILWLASNNGIIEQKCFVSNLVEMTINVIRYNF